MNNQRHIARQFIYLGSGLLLGLLAVTGWLHALRTAGAAGAASGNRTWLEPVAPPAGYAAFYQAETGYAPNPTYFGIYSLLPVSDTVYLGLGTGRPAEADGALLAHSNGLTVTAVTTGMSEQGFIDMEMTGDTVYIPGTDPCCDDGWSWGNIYHFRPPAGPLTKLRTLTDVLHTWGLAHFPDDNTLYAATSGLRNPETMTGTGWIFRSHDQGETWQRLADFEDGVGTYRTYDIHSAHGRLYIIWNDYVETADNSRTVCGLAASDDGGFTWQRFAARIRCRARLVEYQNRILLVNEARDALIAVDGSGVTTTYPLPGFRVPDWVYNVLAPDGTDRLYTVTENGQVLVTDDLVSWQVLASTDRAFITAAYWPAKEWLLLGDRGAVAGLWRVDLATATPITLPPPPLLRPTGAGGDLWLNWDPVTATTPVSGYRVYRSTDAYFASHLSNYLTSTTTGSYHDTTPGAVFYTVRTVDTAGILSRDAAHIGKIDYAIATP